MNGKITLFIGPMYSGKTSRVGDEVFRYHIANKSCIIVKYKDDDRYTGTVKNSLLTHSGREFSSHPVIKALTLTEVFEEISECDVIGIDEIQFFDDNVEVLQSLANSGKIIFCAGLDANSDCKPFKRIAEVIAISEDVIKLKAVCMGCGNHEASFSYRMAPSDDEIDIGSFGKYASLCRRCMFDLNPDSKNFNNK